MTENKTTPGPVEPTTPTVDNGDGTTLTADQGGDSAGAGAGATTPTPGPVKPPTPADVAKLQGAGSGDKGAADQGDVGGDQGDVGGDQGDVGGDQGDVGGDQFPREYVERLRRENKNLRQRAVYGDELKGRLFRALVKNDGRLRDPDALPYDESLLDDPTARAAAISALLADNPALGTRHATGDIGAGARGHAAPPRIDIISAIRAAQG